jgi:NADH-quinone oxidoreductase subunit C
MKQFEEILEGVRGQCFHNPPAVDVNTSPRAIVISKEDLLSVAVFLLEEQSMYFDSLSCLTGIDNGPATGKMEVVYNLYSIPYNHHLMIKVELPRDTPRIESVSHLWRTAEWMEREIFDMYGIVFSGHPDLRRILMPADWDGHPLRKDYKEQEYYRDIKVAF